MRGAHHARRTGLLLGVLIALASAIWQFPNPGSIADGSARTTGSAITSASVTTGGPAAPGQSALDQVLGKGRSVITVSTTYGAASSGQTTTYDPQHVAVLGRSKVTAPGHQGSVTDNGVSRTITDSSNSGQIQRISVAVLVDSSLRPAPKLAMIRRTITAALGLQPRRGDTITVTRAPISAASNSASMARTSVNGQTSATAPPATRTARITSYLPSAFGMAVALVLLLTLAMDAVHRASSINRRLLSGRCRAGRG